MMRGLGKRGAGMRGAGVRGAGVRGRLGAPAVLRWLLALALLAALSCAFAPAAWADEEAAESVGAAENVAAAEDVPDVYGDVPLITIRELILNPLKYDGMLLAVSGEAVGDIINGESARYKWVNINADGYSLGVYMETSQSYGIEHLGRYGVQGTVISAVGVFHAACAEGHAGELDLHAYYVTVRDVGGELEKAQTDWSFVIGAVLVFVLGVLLFVIYSVVADRYAGENDAVEAAEGLILKYKRKRRQKRSAGKHE